MDREHDDLLAEVQRRGKVTIYSPIPAAAFELHRQGLIELSEHNDWMLGEAVTLSVIGRSAENPFSSLKKALAKVYAAMMNKTSA